MHFNSPGDVALCYECRRSRCHLDRILGDDIVLAPPSVFLTENGEPRVKMLSHEHHRASFSSMCSTVHGSFSQSFESVYAEPLSLSSLQKDLFDEDEMAVGKCNDTLASGTEKVSTSNMEMSLVASNVGCHPGAHLSCSLCSTRACNPVLAGDWVCCWDCVVRQGNSDFVKVGGTSHDMRDVKPGRALLYFLRSFKRHLPMELAGLDKLELPSQMTVLGAHIQTLHVTAMVRSLFNPCPIAHINVGNGVTVHSDANSIPRIRVLIVDDDSTQRMLLKSMLKSIAWECEEVDNGAMALERSMKQDFDLVSSALILWIL